MAWLLEDIFTLVPALSALPMNKPYVHFYTLPFTEILLLHNAPFVPVPASSSPTNSTPWVPHHSFTSLANQYSCHSYQLEHLLPEKKSSHCLTSFKAKSLKDFGILKTQPKGVGWGEAYLYQLSKC